MKKNIYYKISGKKIDVTPRLLSKPRAKVMRSR
jgi:hypothetical protein